MTVSKTAFPVVQFTNNKLTTTSRNIAAVFGKQHKDVLKAIDNLDAPEEFGRRNFAPSNYQNQQGKTQTMYGITRDGFTILVMGFIGPKAMKFKLAYIEAFNKMEAELSHNLAPAVLDTEILKTLVATSQQILGLRDQLGVLTRLEDSLGHLDITARTMNASVEQLSKISHIESAVRERIDQFRNDFNKATERAYQRSNNDYLGKVRLDEELRRVNARLAAIETLLTQEDSSRKGIIGFLETYLPQHEATDVQTTGNMTPENNPEKFVRECCTLDPFSSVELTFLYKVYKAWSLSRFAQALGPNLFWEYLQDHLPEGVTMEVRKSKRNIIGLKPTGEKNGRSVARRDN
jgi:Rha family phage regulatory protein